MSATDILSSEHRVIEQALNCLEKIVEQGQREGSLAKQPAQDAIAFFRNFADRCHHGKEETHLFPAMEAKGCPPEDGPTEVMRREHELGRSHVRAMAEAVDSASAGDAVALKLFHDHALGYVTLLRAHIEKEDHCLFAIANGTFLEEDQKRLLEIFERVEREEMGEGTHEKFLEIANRLAAQYGVPLAATTEAHHGCCAH